MVESQNVLENTPGGNQSTTAKSSASKASDSGELAASYIDDMEPTGNLPNKIKHKHVNFMATININSLLKTGKLKQLTNTLTENKILIAAVQETRFTDKEAFESEGYRIFKGKTGERVASNIPHLGTAFVVSCRILNSVIDFQSFNGRISTLSIRCTNKLYTLVNVHAPINRANKTNKEETDIFWEELEEIIMKIPNKHTVILLGDFNAQLGREKKFRHIVGNYPAHHRTNRNGERLIGLCKAANLIMKSTAFKHLPRKQKTWSSPNPKLGEFQIDHVAISAKSMKEIQNVKVIRNAQLDSDHYMSKIKVKFQPMTHRRQNKPKSSTKIIKYDTEKLKNNSSFKDKLTNQSPENWEEMKEILVQTAKETIPLTKNKKHQWWTEECDEAITKRQQAWQQWNSKKNEENKMNFLQVRKETTKLIRNTKRSHIKNQLHQIEEDFQKNNTRDFYKTFKQNLKKYSPPNLFFKDDNGKMAYNDEENCHILANYFESLLNCTRPETEFNFKEGTNQPPDSLPPDKEEIIDIIQSLKNNKAPGEDSITAELWKNVNTNFIEKLTDIIQNMWITEEIPQDWKTALIHPLHKKGDKSDVNNYRGISLLPVTYKILSKALLNRAEEQLDSQIGEYQCGFRKGRSCTEQIFNLKSIMLYLKRRSKEFVITFVDFKKAYDSIDRTSLFNTLNEFNLDNKTANLIKATLEHTYSKVKFRGEISRSFEIKTGVRQGDGLSPLLFNCILEKVIREWRKAMEENKIEQKIRLGYKKDNLKTDCLAFADDVAILSDSVESATIQIELLKEQAEKAGLQISFDKTMYITNNKVAPKKMKTKYGLISRTTKFKYLGEIIEENISEKEAVRLRVNKLQTAYYLTKEIYNKKSISINAKLKHYLTVIRPEALYAAECLTLNKKNMMEELEITERRVLRKILGPIKDGDKFRRRHNNELYRHFEKITDTIRKRRIRFYGHIRRMDQSRFTGRVLNYFRKLKLANTWFTVTEKDLNELQITDEDVKERALFRSKLKKSTGFKEEPKKKTGAAWTDERKENHRERMKELWKKWKRDGKKQLKHS